MGQEGHAGPGDVGLLHHTPSPIYPLCLSPPLFLRPLLFSATCIPIYLSSLPIYPFIRLLFHSLSLSLHPIFYSNNIPTYHILTPSSLHAPSLFPHFPSSSPLLLATYLPILTIHTFNFPSPIYISPLISLLFPSSPPGHLPYPHHSIPLYTPLISPLLPLLNTYLPTYLTHTPSSLSPPYISPFISPLLPSRIPPHLPTCPLFPLRAIHFPFLFASTTLRLKSKRVRPVSNLAHEPSKRRNDTRPQRQVLLFSSFQAL